MTASRFNFLTILGFENQQKQNLSPPSPTKPGCKTQLSITKWTTTALPIWIYLIQFL